MREPYATMLGQYHDHWLFAQYLIGEEPDWSGLAADDRMNSLSVGEKVLLDFAAAWANTQIYLDEICRYRVWLSLQQEFVPR